ncbi:MAG: hypothetical protein HZA35_02585 [Parcubacteria group bacterium]|nr:hypothetical protein [Parcubacteria group bacterium]
MVRQEQLDIEEKTYTLIRFQPFGGIAYSCIKLLARIIGGVNVYYSSCCNSDDPSSCRLALEGQHARELIEYVLGRTDFEYKVVRGRSNTPYALW